MKLLEDDTFITKMLLIEKSKNTEETVETLEKVIERTKEEDKDVLIRIIKIVFKEKLGDDEVERLVNKIEEGRKKEVLAVVDMIRRENQMYIDMGRKEGFKEIARKLFKMGLTSEQVEEATQLKKEEIEKIAKECKIECEKS